MARALVIFHLGDAAAGEGLPCANEESNPSHPNAAPKIEVTKFGPTPKGLPVWKKRGDTLMEITELSRAELDPKLFEPPSGFRRMLHPMPGEQLSWSEKILFGRQQFEDWIGNSAVSWTK